jgi:hypothetical protein
LFKLLDGDMEIKYSAKIVNNSYVYLYVLMLLGFYLAIHVVYVSTFAIAFKRRSSSSCTLLSVLSKLLKKTYILFQASWVNRHTEK